MPAVCNNVTLQGQLCAGPSPGHWVNVLLIIPVILFCFYLLIYWVNYNALVINISIHEALVLCED